MPYAEVKPVRKCLFPAAGAGTRFLPATKEIPKEMLPLIDRPLIHYGVEEAVNSGCGDIIFVTGRGKRSIEDYFDRSWELEELLEARGKTGEMAMIRRISDMARFAYVRQSEPLGLGHAVLCGEPFCENGPFGVILPDDVMIPGEGCAPILAQLADVHAKHGGSVLALEEVPEEDVSRYGIVEAEPVGDGVFEILDLVEKPSRDRAPSTLAIMGRYVLTPGIFPALKNMNRGAGGEYQLTDGIRGLLGNEPVWGCLYRGRRFDCGTKESWLRATVAMALGEKDLRNIVLEEVRRESGR